MRFHAIVLICFVGLPILAGGSALKQLVVVVTAGDADAYAQAVAGIREQIMDIQIWDERDQGLRVKFTQAQPAVAIAVGGSAAALVDQIAPSQVALVNTMVFTSELEGGGTPLQRFKSIITIDLPPEELLNEVVRLFPEKTRIGIIRGPSQSDAYMKSFEAAARHAGMTVEVVSCDTPRDLVASFLKLRSRADLVWCPPNIQLYNSATLKPLLMASLSNRLPIIGFSERFVQAGALFGGSANFAEVGRQTASVAARILRNEPVPARQPARKFRFAYNQRVGRIFGWKAAIAEGSDEVVIIR